MTKLRVSSAILCAFLIHICSNSQGLSQDKSFETLINQRLADYDLSPDNHFKLAAYTELKGKYSNSNNSLTLEFGSIASLSFYERNCLLRTADNRVYHLDQSRNSTAQVYAMNSTLANIFEKIILLSNHNSDQTLIEFVDKHLSRKNIEPFQKIFLRHILIKYGKFDEENKRVEFHTDWLPEKEFTYKGPNDERLIRKPIDPLLIKLDASILRGYYLRSGGTVYVEDVRRDVHYATGEQYDPNVTAFKIFVQKLFVQTTQYIVRQENKRIQEYPNQPVITTIMQKGNAQPQYESDPDIWQSPIGLIPNVQIRKTNAPTLSFPTTKPTIRRQPAVKPLYDKYNWIPMMLGIMRSNNISIADKDVIEYFIDQPYFPILYEQLTAEEKKKVDRFRK